MKYFGKIGFAELVETAVDVYEEKITEKEYFGDVVQNYRKIETNGEVNDEVTVTNKISILADPFANERINKMRYLVFAGVKWKINHVEIDYPRLILSIGGEYHGTDESESESETTSDFGF